MVLDEQIEDELFIDWGKSFSRIFLTISIVLFVIYTYPEKTIQFIPSPISNVLLRGDIFSRIKALSIATLVIALTLRILVSLKIGQINDDVIETKNQ